MSSLAEVAFDRARFSGKAQTAISPSYGLVKQATGDADDLIETSANADYPKGRANQEQTVVDGAVECQALWPSQTLQLISDGTLDAFENLVMPSAVVAGRVAKATPAAGQVIIGLAHAAQATAGALQLVHILSPFRYAAT